MRPVFVFSASRGYLRVMVISVILVLGIASAALGYSRTRQPLAGKRIAIDPGHGGEDPGYTTGDVLEKDLNLALAKMLAEELKKSGATVTLTRDSDKDYILPRDQRQGKTRKQSDLDQRVRIITNAHPDLVLSVHANATRNPDYSGPEVFYLPSSITSHALAKSIQEELRKVPGVQKRLPKEGDYYLFRQLEMPTVIIETGFLTNPQERKRLLDPEHQRALVLAITEGINKFFGHSGIETTMAGVDAKVAIVIDDLGYKGNQGTAEILALKVPLTLAIMPNMPDTRELAEEAFKRDFEVIVHLPMEPEAGLSSWLPPGAITTGLTITEVKRRAQDALAQVPYAVGANNHMGSKVTSDPKIMEAVLAALKEKGLFYLNSRTSPPEVVRNVASTLRVPVVERDLFLDEVNSLTAIKKQLHSLQQIALQKGAAIGIGHVGPQGKNTAQAIREMAPEMERAGVRFVQVSDLIQFPLPEFEADLGAYNSRGKQP